MKDQAKAGTKICNTLLEDNIIPNYPYILGCAEG
jgi:hypothetical protein